MRASLRRSIASEIKSECRRRNIEPALVATVGSSGTANQTTNSDLDLLAIMGADAESSRTVFSRYSVFLQLISSIQVSYGMPVVLVPANLLKSTLGYFARKRPRLLLHLLIYPRPSYFLRWENPHVVNGVCRSARRHVILGDKSILDEIAVKNSSRMMASESFAFLLKRLTQSHVYVTNPTIPRDLAIEHGLHMLKYCIKHLETLNKEGVQGPHVSSFFPGFYQQDGLSSNATLTPLRNLLVRNEKTIELSEITKGYELAFDYFALLEKRYLPKT
jgi:hypothetical protein